MGIESFFSSIQQNNIINKTGTIQEIIKKIKCDFFGIDFNSIIHVTSQKLVRDINIVIFNLLKYDEKNLPNRINNIIEFYNLPNTLKEIKKIDIDKLVLREVIKTFKNILSNLVDPELIKTLYIGVDGVPGKGKIIEQKKRRYLGTMVGIFKQQIYQDHLEEIKKHRLRYQYEQNKISWNKNKITPGTFFMNDLHIKFNDTFFIEDLKKICPNMKKYIFSGPYEPGEGEKKIVNYMRDNKFEKSVIFSPDSDVTLLALLMVTPEDNNNQVKVIRHNQQKDTYDVIDANKLSNNIYLHVKPKLQKIKKNVKQGRFIEDIVMIFSILGNDFVPKIISFDVREDFNNIIDRYLEYLESNQDKDDFYLITIKNNKRIILLDNLKKMFKILKKDEGGQLNKKYMSTHYKNYKILKKKLGEENFNEKLSALTDDIKLFLNLIQNNKEDEIYNKISKTSLNIIKNTVRLDHVIPRNIKELIDETKNYYDRNNKLPKIQIFTPFKKTIHDHYHQSKLKASLDHLDANLTILEYDKEIYKMENMLDEYFHKFNAYKLQIGMITLDPNHLSWKSEKIIDGVKRYYNEFFDIEEISMKNKSMYNLVENYVKCLLSVFEYYYNWYDEKENRLNAQTWYYEYNKAPLMTQIYDYLNTLTDFENLNVMNYTERENFFNPLEQLMYVTPMKENLILCPSEYKDFVLKSNYYIDLNKIGTQILKENKKLIDCRGAIFLNKCHLKILDTLKINDDEFIKKLRNIPLKKENIVLQGTMSGISRVNEYNIKDVIKMRRMNNKNNKNNKNIRNELKKTIYEISNELYIDNDKTHRIFEVINEILH